MWSNEVPYNVIELKLKDEICLVESFRFHNAVEEGLWRRWKFADGTVEKVATLWASKDFAAVILFALDKQEKGEEILHSEDVQLRGFRPKWPGLKFVQDLSKVPGGKP
jgi:hypothetical protein